MATLIKTGREIQKIRVAGKILAAAAVELIKIADVDISLKKLDDLATKFILKAGAKPAFLGYLAEGAEKPYSNSICASVNETVVHGIPTEYQLKSGDVLKLDFGVLYDGYYADAAWTIGVGEISPLAKKLIQTTKTALDLAIKTIEPGKALGNIGYTINNFVTKHGFKVVKGLTGHGIGKDLHEDPTIFNEGRRGIGLKLESGMVLAIEPMVSAGSSQIIQNKDGSYSTADNSLSAHFEHTILITKNGAEILTQ